LNFKLIIGTIGIVLVACNILLFLPWMPFLSYFHRIPLFGGIMMWDGLFLLNMVVGLVLYIIGRKDLLVFGISSILTFFGLTLTTTSLLFLSLVAIDTGSKSLRELAIYLTVLAWSGLGFLSGVLWLVDGAKTGEDELLPSKKEIDLESQIEYPKDLLAKYLKQYPHNPIGVLEWHIDKKMKEGKTREQAIKELQNMGDRSI